MKKDKIYPGKFLGLLLLGVCIAVCAVSGGRLFRTGLEYKRQEADLLRMRRLTGGRKEDIGQAGAEMTGQNAEKGADRAAAERAGQAAEDGAALWEDQTARLDRCRRSWEANPDTIGWISIPGTEIDYPVMHTPEDPDFYLNHGFDQEPSAGGMIYLDAGDDCGGRKVQEPAEAEAARRNNFILYGHHMKNGTMFAGLEQYLDPEFFKEHRTIFFDTLAGAGEYEAFAVFSMTAAEAEERLAPYLAAESREQYGRLMEIAGAESIGKPEETPVWPQRLLTLMTCEYTQNEGRLFLMAYEKGEKHDCKTGVFSSDTESIQLRNKFSQ